MPAPMRRRPGSESPIRLSVEVESVRTPATPPVEAQPVAAPATSIVQAVEATPPKPTRRRGQRQTGAPARAREAEGPEPKVAVTVQLRDSLRRQAQTAVLRTAGLPGGHRSFAALIDAAVSREIESLEAAFNNGRPFEPNQGEFRTGRPFAN